MQVNSRQRARSSTYPDIRTPAKNAILLNEISGDSLLTLIQPAGDGNEEKRKRSDPLAPAAYHAQSRACNDPNEFFWILQAVD
jgi:hypothetical protein